MRAAYPYVDDFLPAGTVASLERLGEILSGVRATDNRRSGEAAAGVTSAETVRPLGPAELLEPGSADPTTARLLRH